MIKGRKIVVCAREGGANTTPILAAHFAKQNTKFGGGEKARAEKFFCSAALRAAIKIQSPDFRQKKFGFRPKGTANLRIFHFRKRLPRFCEDLPRSAWPKGNGLISDLEVRLGKAQSKMKFCNQSFSVSPLAKLGSDNFNILTASI